LGKNFGEFFKEEGGGGRESEEENVQFNPDPEGKRTLAPPGAGRDERLLVQPLNM